MALNLKTLGIRSLSSIVFVVLLVGCLVSSYYSFTLFFFLVAIMGLNEFYKIAEKLGAKPYKFIGFVAGIVLYFSFIDTVYILNKVNFLIYASVVLPFLIFLVALFSRRDNPIQNSIYTMVGLVYSVLPFALLHHFVIFKNIGDASTNFYPFVLLGIILLIWSNDTFAYLGGSLFGKHKMIERISPGKTWEGTIFGILVTFGISFLIKSYFKDENALLWIILGISVPIISTVGDLVESMLKRQANIKDSGSIMPGHGGILDRFDSLIFVSPFVFVLLKLLQS